MRITSLLILPTCLYLATVCAQKLTVPSSWVGTTPTLGRDARSQAAQSGLAATWEAYYNGPNPAWAGTLLGWPLWDTGRMFWTMALKDYAAGTAENINVTAAILAVNASNPGFQTPYWGLGAVYSYKAYNDSNMLSVAQAIWNTSSPYQVHVSQLPTGRNPTRNVTFAAMCNNQPISGAFFQSTVPNTMLVQATDTAYFALFSALLAELAGEPVSGLHLSAALSSATFLQALLYDPATALVGDSVTLASSAVSCVVGVDPKMSAAAGAALSAFAVLAELAPGLGFDELVRNITAAATSTTLWVGLDGVVTEGAQGTDDDEAAKGMLVRGLYEVWARSADANVKARIAAFVSVQANAVLGRASSAPGVYAPDWRGPPPANYSMAGALAGLDVLAAAIGPAGYALSGMNATASTAVIEPSATATPGVSEKHKHTRAALSTGLGVGLPLAAVLLGVVLARLRRTQRRRDRQEGEPKLEAPEHEDSDHRRGWGPVRGRGRGGARQSRPHIDSSSSESDDDKETEPAQLDVAPLTPYPPDVRPEAPSRERKGQLPAMAEAPGPSVGASGSLGVHVLSWGGRAPAKDEPASEPDHVLARVSTTALVRELNERLQTGGADELPPVYDEPPRRAGPSGSPGDATGIGHSTKT